MRKEEMVDLIAREVPDTPKDKIATIIDQFLYNVETDLVKAGRIVFSGFGRFKVTKRAAGKGVNPHTGEAIDLPAVKIITFKAGKRLRERLARNSTYGVDK